ncbi:multicopper oxidase domain-containing protein [Rhizobium sp. BG4]|uniref:multicopper oxidase domain-containing protein n=1 Tax=Rhizobium sp. BG4 TaxID=2613770 RepID=UPI0032B23FB5
MLDADTAFNVQLSSQIDQPTLIHWHGLTPPWDQDGVPDNPAAPIKPGENRAYNFHLGAGAPIGCMPIRFKSRACWLHP